MDKYEIAIKNIEALKKQKEEELSNLQVNKKVLLNDLNQCASKLKELGYTVQNEEQAKELLEKLTPSLDSTIESISSKIGSDLFSEKKES